MTAPTAAQVTAALDMVCDPCSLASGTPLGLAEMGLLREWSFAGGVLTVTICVTGPGCTYIGPLAEHARAALAELPGVREVEVRLDLGVIWSERLLSDAARSRLADARRLRTVP